MGMPLSPFLADIVMSDLEMQVTSRFSDIFKFWVRYVDDVFCLVDGDKIDEGLRILNSQQSSLQFTLEVEKEGKLPFLDLLLFREEDKIKVDIFRKPTSTDVYIHQSAFNPTEHKLAVFRYLTNRLINTPLNDSHFKKESAKIVEIAKKNGFPTKMVTNMISKSKYQKTEKSLNSFTVRIQHKGFEI